MSTSPRSPRGFFPADLSPLLPSGWQTNKFDASIPFWEEVDGVQFTESSIKPRRGRFRGFSTSIDKPIRGIITMEEFDTRVWYIGDTNKLYRIREDDFSTGLVEVGSGYGLVEVAGSTFWDNSTSVWDNGSSSWDLGITQSSLWSLVNFGSWVVAADNTGPLQIKKNHETFADLQNGKVSGIVITNDTASGYNVGDTLTFTGGTGSNLEAEITEILLNKVTRVKITNYGSAYTDGNTLTATSGSFECTVQVSNCPFTRVKAVDKSGPHILAINYDKESGTHHPYDVAWCSADNPDDWVASSTNSAGSLTLREANSELRCIVALGESKAIYTDDQMFILTYTGDPFYFGYQTAMTSGVGAVSPKSVVSVDRLNYGLSKKGLFMTDGNSVTILGEKEGINQYIKDNISLNQYGLVNAFHSKNNNEVVWNLPLEDTKCNTEIIYNYKTGVFSKRTRDNSAVAEAGVFEFATSGTSDGYINFEEFSEDDRYVYALTKAHDLGDPYAIKEITSIRVGKIGNANPKIEIGWANKIDDAPTFNVEDSFYANEEYKEYNIRTSGRYLFLKISSEDAHIWEIFNIVIKGRTRGFR